MSSKDRWAVSGMWGVLASACLAGCPTDDPAKPGASFSPAEGLWTEEATVYDEDGCGFDGGETETGTFELVGLEGSGFEMRYEETDDGPALVLTCTLQDRRFDCEPLESTEDTGYDAVITVVASASGTFRSKTEGTVDGELRTTCEGTDCAAFAPLDDCVSVGHYEIHLP